MSRLDNKMDTAKGKVKEAVGDATDDRDLEEEGKADQASGRMGDAVDDVKDAASDAKDAVKRAFD